MRRTIALMVAVMLGLAASSCIRKKEWNQPRNDLDLLLSWMNGSFTSQAQATADSAFFDIRLEMLPIWPERDDGYWLYVEQASAATLDRPYRQRVYHLNKLDDSTLMSSVFEIDQPLRFAGQWRNPEIFSVLTQDSLIKREGCTIYLHLQGDSVFVGSTDGTSCRSDHRGAAYATSEVRITEEYLMSWERGFDSTGTQIWGAENGGYVFRRARSQ